MLYPIMYLQLDILYKILYNLIMKTITFLSNSLDELREFPLSARRDAGYQLDRVQHGLEPSDWKPMSTVGAGVNEIRVRDENGVFRVMYVAKFAKTVYVLHCFQKKTQRTSKKDLDIAHRRYQELKAELKP